MSSPKHRRRATSNAVSVIEVNPGTFNATPTSQTLSTTPALKARGVRRVALG